MARWGCQDCPALYGAWLSRCPRCGSAKELVVALSVCTDCTTKYAVGLAKCPHCGSTDHVEDGQPMPKITAHGGPSSVTAGPGEPGYMPPVGEPEPAVGGVVADVPVVGEDGPEEASQSPDVTADLVSAEAAPKGGEESSPGTSSSTSTETPEPKSEPSSSKTPSRARTTGSRSKKAPTESPSADSADGDPAADTSEAADQ